MIRSHPRVTAPQGPRQVGSASRAACARQRARARVSGGGRPAIVRREGAARPGDAAASAGARRADHPLAPPARGRSGPARGGAVSGASGCRGRSEGGGKRRGRPGPFAERQSSAWRQAGREVSESRGRSEDAGGGQIRVGTRETEIALRECCSGRCRGKSGHFGRLTKILHKGRRVRAEYRLTRAPIAPKLRVFDGRTRLATREREARDGARREREAVR